MNMMDSPKFRRKHKTASRALEDGRNEARSKAEAGSRAAQGARAKAETETRVRADEDTEKAAQTRAATEACKAAEADERRKAEFEKMARAEALRRIRARKAAEADAARKAAEEQRARQVREAEERHRAAEAKREQEVRQRAEAEAQAAAEARAAADAARKTEQERRAQEARAAKDRRRAEGRGEADEQRETAARPAPPLPLTDMIPVTPTRAGSAEAVQPPGARIEDAWTTLTEISVDVRHLERNRIITARREDPAHAAFDVLRTRLLQALSDHGWRRVAITSPGKDCGKTFAAANLAISLSRQENCRTLLMDLDMRRPSLHSILGVDSPGSVGGLLRGKTRPEDHLHRMGENPIHAGRNIAFALNDTVEPYASELLQDPRTAATLDRIEETYAPDVVLFDLPPALFDDDVIAARPIFDGVLLVIGGGLTTEREINEVETRLGASVPILGMVLNKAEGSDPGRYRY